MIIAESWLEQPNPDAELGQVRFALFDFDGTISVIRRGWEEVMIPLMLEMISGDQPITPEMETEVVDFVDKSTGIMCIKQMRWLAEAVRRYGLNPNPLTAAEYKQLYNERLMVCVTERIAQMDGNQDALMIEGARPLLQGLVDRGVTLFLASGTDHEFVVQETAVLGVEQFFQPHVYGAIDDDETTSKEYIIANIIQENNLHGSELLVVGDGPVEIRQGKLNGAVTLGIAADEAQRSGLDPRKRQRLLTAEADLIVTDFNEYEALLNLLVHLGS